MMLAILFANSQAHRKTRIDAAALCLMFSAAFAQIALALATAKNSSPMEHSPMGYLWRALFPTNDPLFVFG